MSCTKGQISNSREYTERNLRRCEKRNWPESIAYCKRLLSDIAIVENDFNKASQLYKEALNITRKFGIQEQTASILLGLAKISISDGKFDDALVNLISALDIADKSGYVIQKIDILNSLAELHIIQYDLEEARNQAQVALRIAINTEFAWGRGTALYILGYIASLLNNQVDARELLKQAYEIQQKIQDPHTQVTKELMNSFQ